MQGIKLNGCDVSTYSRLSSKCRKCENKHFCGDKRKEMAAAVNGYSEPSTSPLARAGVSLAEMAISVADAAESFRQVGILVNEAQKQEEITKKITIEKMEAKRCKK